MQLFSEVGTLHLWQEGQVTRYTFSVFHPSNVAVKFILSTHVHDIHSF